MLAVDFYELDDKMNDIKAGTVIYDGQKIRVQGPRWIKELLKDGIVVGMAETKTVERIKLDQPEKFLQNLHRQYNNAYLRASKAREVGRGDNDKGTASPQQ